MPLTESALKTLAWICISFRCPCLPFIRQWSILILSIKATSPFCHWSKSASWYKALKKCCFSWSVHSIFSPSWVKSSHDSCMQLAVGSSWSFPHFLKLFCAAWWAKALVLFAKAHGSIINFCVFGCMTTKGERFEVSLVFLFGCFWKLNELLLKVKRSNRLSLHVEI